MNDYLSDWKFINGQGRISFGKVTLVVDRMRGSFVSNNQFGLEVFNNKYIQFKQIPLASKTLESACNEAMDVYRALLTDSVEYLTKQINLLPEI